MFTLKSKAVSINQHLHKYTSQLIHQVLIGFIFTIKIKFMKQLRQTILADEELIASKRRFGLFSQPPPLGLGDDSIFPAKTAKKGEDGKPITKPRNMLSGVNRSGVGRKSYINVPDSIYNNDPYVQTFKKQLEYQKRMHSKSAMHEAEFRPVCGIKPITNSAYPHIEEKEDHRKKVIRDDSGRVKTQPANIVTNPTSKVQNTLFKPLDHKPDPFDRLHEISKQEKQIWRSKIIHENMFKTMSHGGSVFTKDKVQYGLDDKAKSLVEHKAKSSSTSYHRYNHQNKFKLARRGFGDPIARYPAYVPPRAKTEASEVAKTNEKGEQESWKPAACTLSRPTPSISLMPTNMRKFI